MEAMKREIKFRAWDKKKKAMVYSSPLHISVEEDDPVNVYYRFNIATITGPTRESVKNLSAIMQYTGLKSKSGVEIYEGDILDIYNRRYFVKEALPFISLEDKNGWEYNNGDYYEGSNIQSHNWKDFEVIGNIYENPELLENK